MLLTGGSDREIEKMAGTVPGSSEIVGDFVSITSGLYVMFSRQDTEASCMRYPGWHAQPHALLSYGSPAEL